MGSAWDQNAVARHLRRSLWEAIHAAFAPRDRDCLPDWKLEEALEEQNNVNLMAAAYCGYCGEEGEIAEFLNSGADVNACTQDGYTPLMFAAAFNSAEVVRVLAENGADVNARSFQRQTALTIAILCGPNDPKVMRALAEAGADVNVAYDDGSTPLMLAVEYCGNAEVAAELIDAGADIHARRKDGRSALELAMEAGRCGAVRSLLAAGADPAPLLEQSEKV